MIGIAPPAWDTSRPEPEHEGDILGPHRVAARARVHSHSEDLRRLLAPLPGLIAAGRYLEAATRAQIAANHAVLWHAGIFSSALLDSALRDLGAAALPTSRRRVRPRGEQLRILHVATAVAGIGGHTRMMWRWIGCDRGNIHSLALTRQSDPVPALLTEAVASSGGGIRQINRTPGGILQWARRLQSEIGDADLIVLHTHNMDIIPLLALAGMRERPPVALLDHADHAFWAGANLIDAVISTRQSGRRLCLRRRGIDPARSVLLPLCLDSAPTGASPAQARRQLNISDDRVVLLSVARSSKFTDFEGMSFLDHLVPVLRSDPRLLFIALGAGDALQVRVNGLGVGDQVRLLPESPDTGVYFRAADIYLDTFPFASNTSMFEAGLHGVPVVTYFPFGPDCDVLGGDSPGLDRELIRARSDREFAGHVQRLAGDTALRRRIGSRLRAEITATNTGSGWSESLARCYDRILQLPRRAQHFALVDDPAQTEDLDILLPIVFEAPVPATSSARLAFATEIDLYAFPFWWKIRNCGLMAWRGEFVFRKRSDYWKYLAPEWFFALRRSVMPGCV